MVLSKKVFFETIFFFVFCLIFVINNCYILYCGTIFLFCYRLSYHTRYIPSLIIHWINPFFIIHNIGILIYEILVFEGEVITPVASDLMKASFVSFFTFNIFFLLIIRNKKIKEKKFKLNENIYKVVFIICLVSVLVYIRVVFINSSLTSKRSIINFVNEIPMFGYLYALTNILISLSIFKIYKHNKRDKKALLIYLTLYSFIFLLLGERDLLFTFLIGVFFFIGINRGKFPSLIYYSFFLASIFLAPVTQNFKSALISGTKEVNIIENFKSMGFNDFMTVGANFERVYYKNGLTQEKNKNLILDDFGNVIKLSKNSARWYFSDFLGRSEGTTGYGFSLELQGVMSMGLFGVFILYLILSIVCGVIYLHLKNNTLGLSFLVALISLIIYVQRQDLAFFLNYSLKFIILPYLLLSKRVFKN